MIANAKIAQDDFLKIRGHEEYNFKKSNKVRI